jgi:hypothetical protein
MGNPHTKFLETEWPLNRVLSIPHAVRTRLFFVCVACPCAEAGVLKSRFFTLSSVAVGTASL